MAQAIEIASNSTTSPDIHLNHSQGVLADEEAGFDVGSGYSKVNFGALPVAADVDAVHGLPNGHVLFSVESAILLGDTLYRANDIIRFDGSNWSKELDGSAQGIPDGVNIDAVSMSNDKLVISIDTDARMDGVTFDDSDIISFDGNEFELFWDASSFGINRAADMDALHINEKGDVLVSFEGSGSIGGVNYDDEDLLAFDTLTWSLEFDGSADDASWLPADLDAFSMVFINDHIFKHGFEAADG